MKTITITRTMLFAGIALIIAANAASAATVAGLVDGKLKYADGDASKGKTPRAVAAAYTNSFAGTKETALYDIDVANGMLVKQAPPNDGILNTIGALGVKLDGGVAFDIAADGKGG